MRSSLPLFILLFSLSVLASGCQRIVPPPSSSPVNSTPLVVDEAMQVRDWDRSTNYYANGASVAGGTGYLWQTHEAVKPGHRRIVEAPVAALNIVSMPVGLFVNAPWEAEVIRGERVPPSYTAQPPLPGEPSSNGGMAPEVIDTPMPVEEAPMPDEPAAPVKEPSPAAPIEETPPPPADDVAPVTPAPVAPGVLEPAPPPPAEPSVAPPPPPAPVAPVVPDATPTQPAVPLPPLPPPGAELNK